MDGIIGVDFDNTIVSYDKIIYAIARQRGLIPEGTRKNKRTIRDIIRRLPDGEEEWQRLQALLYGPMMGKARLANGVKTFFKLCRQHQSPVYIISHKTEFAAYDESGLNLRTAATDWMETHRFFEADGLGISPHDVFFTSTRREKIEFIERLRCRYFIDDLEETFLEESFPQGVEKILYNPLPASSPVGGFMSFTSWEDIGKHVFRARR